MEQPISRRLIVIGGDNNDRSYFDGIIAQLKYEGYVIISHDQYVHVPVHTPTEIYYIELPKKGYVLPQAEWNGWCQIRPGLQRAFYTNPAHKGEWLVWKRAES